MTIRVGFNTAETAGRLGPAGVRPGSRNAPLGWWYAERLLPINDPVLLRAVLNDLTTAVILVWLGHSVAVAHGGQGTFDPPSNGEGHPVAAYLPPQPLQLLGDQTFIADHGIRYPCVAGAMANGIASVELVEAMSRGGMLGFYGAAGLAIDRIDAAIQRLQNALGERPYGFNLIHSPNEPAHEAATAELYLHRRVRLVEASAYLDLTLPVVRYRLHGIHRDGDGRIVTPNRIIGKVSRVEVATKFFSPPPERFIRQLVEEGFLSTAQAELARQVPVAQDLTAEADSGGHTDNRPAITLLPTLIACRDRLQKQFGYGVGLRVGAAGGIATPSSVAAALAMGAAYVVTGSINQACIESGSSDTVRGLLAEAGQADVAMAPAADMFEMGVKVQVLKRGTMFAMRAAKLYELYRAFPSLEALPAAERLSLEKNLFRAPLEKIWDETRGYFAVRDPAQIERAETDAKHRMALVFRWYLGQSSRWANAGEPTRQLDYQVWCGPAMGAFNEWTKGTYLEKTSNRKAAEVAVNLLYGAAILNRHQQLRLLGIDLPREVLSVGPIEPEFITRAMRESG